MKRVITRQSCLESSRSENEKIIDQKRASFMVRSKIRGIYGNKWLGSIWLILDPVATALVYLLVLTVVRSNPSPESLFIGVSLFRIFQTSFKSGVSSVSDFTGGIKVERIRTLVVVTSMIRYRLLDSFLASFGVGLILLLYLEMHFEGVLVFLILGQTLGIIAEGFGLNLTLVVKRIPDVGYLVTYFLMLMFFGSPVLYPMSATNGLHYKINQFNPFSFFVETSRFASDLDSVILEIGNEIIVPIMTLLLLLSARGYASIDKQRWEVSSWS